MDEGSFGVPQDDEGCGRRRIGQAPRRVYESARLCVPLRHAVSPTVRVSQRLPGRPAFEQGRRCDRHTCRTLRLGSRPASARDRSPVNTTDITFSTSRPRRLIASTSFSIRLLRPDRTLPSGQERTVLSGYDAGSIPDGKDAAVPLPCHLNLFGGSGCEYLETCACQSVLVAAQSGTGVLTIWAAVPGSRAAAGRVGAVRPGLGSGRGCSVPYPRGPDRGVCRPVPRGFGRGRVG